MPKNALMVLNEMKAGVNFTFPETQAAMPNSLFLVHAEVSCTNFTVDLKIHCLRIMDFQTKSNLRSQFLYVFYINIVHIYSRNVSNFGLIVYF